MRWRDLPGHIPDALERDYGTFEVQPVSSHTQGIAVRLRCESGLDLFCQVATDDDPDVADMQHAQKVRWSLPDAVPTVLLRYSGSPKGYWVQVYDWQSGVLPNLGPDSDDVKPVVATIAALGEMSVPPGTQMPDITATLGRWILRGEDLLGQPVGMVSDRGVYARAVDGYDLSQLKGGNTITHLNLKPSKLRLDGDRVTLLNWDHGGLGPAWLDLALFIPLLVEAGWAPPAAEDVVAQVPAWSQAPAEAVTAVAGWSTLGHLHLARYGRKENKRAAHEASAAAGLEWLHHRLRG